MAALFSATVRIAVLEHYKSSKFNHFYLHQFNNYNNNNFSIRDLDFQKQNIIEAESW